MAPLCPYCQTPLGAAETLVACPQCQATHHPDCYRENGGCAVPGCTGRPSTTPRAPQVTEPISARQSMPTRVVVDQHSLPPVPEHQPSDNRGASRARLTDTEMILIIATLILAIVVVIILLLLLA